MFSEIPTSVLDRMSELELRDAKDRADGTPRLERLRQVPPETGRFIALWAAAAPKGSIIEVGTSAGYSTLWLALACRAKHRTCIQDRKTPVLSSCPLKARPSAGSFVLRQRVV